MSIELIKLSYLLAIARTGSFSRAAEELGVTQPALSRSVAAIEKRFGLRIFDRGSGGVSPTAVGAIVLADIEALVRNASILERNLRLYGQGDAGKVAFGMGPLIGSLLLPGLAAHMLATRPQLQMRCVIKTAAALLHDLLNDAIEVMFCAGEQIAPAPEIIIESMGKVNLGIIARSGHPLTSKATPTIMDLADYPFACAVELQSQDLPGRNGALICDNYELLRQVVLRSDAVWLSSPEMVAEDLAQRRLVEIPVVDRPIRQTDVIMVRLSGRASSPAAQALAVHVVELLAGDSDKSSPMNKRTSIKRKVRIARS